MTQILISPEYEEICTLRGFNLYLKNKHILIKIFKIACTHYPDLETLKSFIIFDIGKFHI